MKLYIELNKLFTFYFHFRSTLKFFVSFFLSYSQELWPAAWNALNFIWIFMRERIEWCILQWKIFDMILKIFFVCRIKWRNIYSLTFFILDNVAYDVFAIENSAVRTVVRVRRVYKCSRVIVIIYTRSIAASCSLAA